ncbi:GDP-mannose 4,6-dehydratase [Rhizobiaceae bacterium n13]|uniref:GDP-mannose 4,6-dehydratase n=1 Tax=Ferirhizobium litorale TaxID=2927786 RepID=A0AAE3QBM1_9HYPH|nr:GDP-mannose 4,6-dehydratase [Fererhizobium litorale]MDI7860747.1 GDP-mannose 4,6-dehydratase [Fererhizobium litorale]MDI7920895.1 GDP-mannose 4,6-dehydratase [Fererhizobium litorale]
MNSAMVTGAAGMIGSHLIDRLLGDGVVVYGLDVMPLERANNLQEARGHSNFHYMQGDIRDKETIERFFRPEASTLYHLASVVGVRHYMEDPLSLIDIAIIGTRNFIALCEKHNVRILFTSTSEVYGRNPAVPWKETDDRILGATSVDRWSYSTSKALIEHMLFGVYRKSGMPMSIVRFFNVYGPRQNPIYVVSQSIYRALRNEAPEVYDGGRQTRCFTYVGDVVDGVVRAATLPDAVGEVFNLGNPTEVAIGDVIDLCLKHSESQLSPVDIETGKKYGSVYEDIERRVPDVSKARERLGWQATTDVSTGIARTIAWARANPWYLA